MHNDYKSVRNEFQAICSAENSFDPVKIAYKLRELGDDYDERVIRPLMKNVQSAGANQVSPNDLSLDTHQLI